MSLYEIYDLRSYKIEKNVPVPERDSNTARMRQLVEEMSKGDSIELPIALLNVAKAVTAASADRFAIREVKDKHDAIVAFRLWKVAESNGN